MASRRRTSPREDDGERLGSVILRGASWTGAAQLTPLAINIVMTPYIISGFGVARYGMFLLASSIVTFLGSFDGGISTSVGRWSAVYAGSDDRASTTRLITSLLVLVTVVGASLFAVLYELAPLVLHLFHVPDAVAAEGTYLLRAMAFILGISQVRGLFMAQLGARQLYAWSSFTSIASYATYAIGLVLTVRGHYGLRGVAVTFGVQAVVATLMIVPRALYFLDRHAIGFLPREELRRFLAYASKVQATGLTNIITTQADTFIVGGLLSVNAVAVYVTGANFATQLRAVPMNALGPISIALSRAYGQGGDAEAVQVFTRLQRRWVQATTGWTATAVGAAYFGVSSWLGPQFRLSGVVACILVAANGVGLWAFTLLLLLGAVGRPGIETRFAVVAVALNLALTVPLVLLFGVLGTVSATAVGGVVGSVYLVRLARSRYDPALRSYFRDVPVLPAVLTMTTVVLLELLVRPVVPRGALGLIVCGAAAAPGLVVFTLSLLGPRTALSMARQRRLASFSA